MPAAAVSIKQQPRAGSLHLLVAAFSPASGCAPPGGRPTVKAPGRHLRERPGAGSLPHCSRDFWLFSVKLRIIPFAASFKTPIWPTCSLPPLFFRKGTPRLPPRPLNGYSTHTGLLQPWTGAFLWHRAAPRRAAVPPGVPVIWRLLLTGSRGAGCFFLATAHRPLSRKAAPLFWQTFIVL